MSHADAGIVATRSGQSDVLRLAIAQALAGANSAVVYATGAIVGNVLAPDPALATLPISIFVVEMAACTVTAGAIARRSGERRQGKECVRTCDSPWSQDHSNKEYKADMNVSTLNQ